jgi:UDP-N-acetylglucosamine--N-acetylmuramyl-(pentapeptide) pyrophosphoryl-undecaprenol N-acetylglucosamine transferase
MMLAATHGGAAFSDVGAASADVGAPSAHADAARPIETSGAPILVMAGGTGGHVFPALSVAKVLRDRGVPVIWLGVPASMESRLVPANGFPIEWVRVKGIRGKGFGAWVMAPLRIVNAVWQAMAVLRRVRPSAVLGAGGYVSGPGGIAAWLMRIPLLIHEQNAIPGLTNRWLARLADQVMQAFPGSFKAGVHARTVGNPVRADITAIAEPAMRFAGRAGRARLLVFGGSLGAQRLNVMVPKALSRIDPEHRPQVRHQAGERGIDAARTAYNQAQVDAEVTPFIDDMAAAYAWADVAVCRAGAMTIAELQAAGLGPLLIPFPAATDDHQTKNAEAMVSVGAGRVLQERDMTPESLSACIAELTADRGRMLEMADAARRSRVIDAAAQVADLCMAAGGSA